MHVLSSTLQKMVASPLHYLMLLSLLHLANGGAYYGHKQPPQHPQQPLPQYNDGYPQQQFLGNEMPHMPFEMPAQPQYGKEIPQLPLQMGKERHPTKGKGEVICTYISANLGLLYLKVSNCQELGTEI